MPPRAEIEGKAGSCRVAALPRECIAQAYPLVQNALPGLRLGDWTDYACDLIAGNRGGAPSGILAAEQRPGWLAGLCAYRGQRDLAHGRILSIEHFIVLSLFDERRIAAALGAAIEATARRHGCAAVHTQLPDAADDVALNALRGLGHRAESRLFCKAIALDAC